MATSECVRIDKWLWAVRLFGSRSLATMACNGGHVKVGGQNAKPSRSVRVGEVVSVLAGGVHRTVRILDVLDRRVGAKLVARYLEDMTSAEECARAREERQKQSSPFPGFPKGFGRPTKKQRRRMMTIVDRL